MLDVENMLDDDVFFADTVDTLQEGTEEQTKRGCLKDAIGKREEKCIYLMAKNNGSMKRLTKQVTKPLIKHMLNTSSNEPSAKGEKSGKALIKPAISMHLTGMSQMVKIRDVQKLQYDFENDPVITDQMDS